MPHTQVKNESGHFHAVRFYEDSQSLARMVAGFIAEGLIAGQPAVVIASPAHSAAISAQLVAMAFNIEKLTKDGHLFVLDARELLDRFMVNGMPNAQLFDDAIIPIIDKASGPGAERVLRAYGEMVDLLWKDGMEAAAVRLEMLWNQLANSRRFSLLCGYSMGSFYKDAGFKDICDQHTHVLSTSGAAARLNVAKTS
jgi:hypothetical protein